MGFVNIATKRISTANPRYNPEIAGTARRMMKNRIVQEESPRERRIAELREQAKTITEGE